MARRAKATTRPRRVRALASLLFTALLLSSARELDAHGALRRSSPAKGAHLGAVPRELRLTFTEPVALAASALVLVGPDGRTVSLGAATVPSDSTRQLVAEITAPLEAGTYTVRWRIAGNDGHPVRGDFTFVIVPGAAGAVESRDATDSSAPVPRTAVPPTVAGDDSTVHTHHDPASFPARRGDFGVDSPLFVAVRWLTYVALLGLIGALAFRFAVLGTMARGSDDVGDSVIPGASERAAAIGWWCSVLLLAAAPLRLVAQSVAIHGMTAEAVDPAMARDVVLQTTWGWGWLLQVAAAAIALFGFARARRHERSGWTIAAAAAVLAAMAPALSGHAAAAPRLVPLAIIADMLHVVGAASWLGSLAVLLGAGVPTAMRLDAGRRGAAVASLVNAFSPTALGFATLVAITGVFSAWLHLGRLGALWESDYGRMLLLKLGVLSLVVLTGAYNWLKVRPALGDDVAVRRLRRSAGVEVAVAVLVVAITAVLVATSPPMSVAEAESGANVTRR